MKENPFEVNKDNYKYSDVTEKIIRHAFEVHNKLGYGFLERVYQNALIKRLRDDNIILDKEFPIKVYFEGEVVGEYFADIFVDGKVIVELKAVEQLNTAHEVQLVNYLKATGVEVGLLLNFGKKLDIKRRVFSVLHNSSA
jgi:GxxExxY protein